MEASPEAGPGVSRARRPYNALAARVRILERQFELLRLAPCSTAADGVEVSAASMAFGRRVEAMAAGLQLHEVLEGRAGGAHRRDLSGAIVLALERGDISAGEAESCKALCRRANTAKHRRFLEQGGDGDAAAGGALRPSLPLQAATNASVPAVVVGSQEEVFVQGPELFALDNCDIIDYEANFFPMKAGHTEDLAIVDFEEDLVQAEVIGDGFATAGLTKTSIIEVVGSMQAVDVEELSEDNGEDDYEVEFFSTGEGIPLASALAEGEVFDLTTRYFAAKLAVSQATFPEPCEEEYWEEAQLTIEALVRDLAASPADSREGKACEWTKMYTFVGLPPDIIESQVGQALLTAGDPDEFERFELFFCNHSNDDSSCSGSRRSSFGGSSLGDLDRQDLPIHGAASCPSGHSMEFVSPHFDELLLCDDCGTPCAMSLCCRGCNFARCGECVRELLGKMGDSSMEGMG